MQSLSRLLITLVDELGGDTAKFAAIARNNIAYRMAVKNIWRDEQSRKLIFDHTNAFYIREDKTPRKGTDKDKPYIVCDIVLDDGLVRSEIDTHRELLMAHLLNEGLRFEKINIIPAKGNMRKRHPFSAND